MIPSMLRAELAAPSALVSELSAVAVEQGLIDAPQAWTAPQVCHPCWRVVPRRVRCIAYIWARSHEGASSGHCTGYGACLA